MKVKFDVMVGKKWQSPPSSDFVFILLPLISIESEQIWGRQKRTCTIVFAWLFFSATFKFRL